MFLVIIIEILYQTGLKMVSLALIGGVIFCECVSVFVLSLSLETINQKDRESGNIERNYFQYLTLR